MQLLAIDTCGPTGSVALGRFYGQSVEILGQIELEGRNYSSTLIAAIRDLLAQTGTQLSLLHAIVAVNGPGSFTGVRVGLAAVKGLAEAAQIPVLAVSRLEVLAAKSGVEWAALDAHRHEVYLRQCEPGKSATEMLTGANELAAIDPTPAQIALCDDAAALLLDMAWPDVEQIRTTAPTAADALRLYVPRVAAAGFADLALLDGHYLRRSDAEIFGATATAAPNHP